MSIKASRRFYGIVLATLAIGAFAACSSDDPGTGTNNNTSGKAGSTTGGTGGTPGTGGAPTAGTTTTGGTPTAGTTSGGSGGSGGGGSTFACKGTKPASNVISSFGDLVVSGDNLTFTAGVPGGVFGYPTSSIKLSDSGMAAKIAGTVGDYSGFGVYLNDCTDASAYTGVSFSIKGNVGSSAKLNFRVQLNSTTPVDAKNSKGTCVVPTGMEPYQACVHPSVDVTGISAAGKTVMISWTDLKAGKPTAAVDPKEIVGFEWAFTFPNEATGGTGGTGGGGTGGASGGTGGASGGTGGASGGTGGASGGSAGGPAGGSGGAAAAGYPVDVTIDDFMFLGGPPAGGTGGTGGTGGASGGTGGASGGTGGASGGTGGASGGTGGGGTSP